MRAAYLAFLYFLNQAAYRESKWGYYKDVLLERKKMTFVVLSTAENMTYAEARAL